MEDLTPMLYEFIINNWKIIDALLVATGLFIYVTASHSLHQRRHPSAAIAWVLGLLLLPYFALPLYLIFGSRKLVAYRRACNMPPLTLDAPKNAVAQNNTRTRSQQLAQVMCLPALTDYQALRIHADGQEALFALRETINSAQHTLDISSFVFGRDVLGFEIAEMLKARVRAGVRVRFLIDGIGIYLGGYFDLKKLTDAGIEVVRFVPPLSSSKQGRTNLRNHRKMTLADGQRLWCGGRNLAAEYFNGDPRRVLGRKPWLDLSFDLSGGIAEEAQHQFNLDWAFANDKTPETPETPATLSFERPNNDYSYPPQAALAQLIDSGPDRADDTIFTLLVSACFTAQQRILAVTPYFVPDTALINALTLAARRGVRIDLVLPERSNHRLADIARHRSLRELAAAGAYIWLHPRMIHAKAVIVDEDLALVGSANLDGRSLFLNYEMMVAFYAPPAIKAFASWIETRRQECVPYLAKQTSVWRYLGEGIVLWIGFQL